MKALPERFSERTITAKCAPEVTFTVRPLDNRIITYINTSNIEMVSEKSGLNDSHRANELQAQAVLASQDVDFMDAKSTGKFHDTMSEILNETKVQEWRINPVGGNYDEVAFGLVSLTGLDGLDLDYDSVKLGRSEYKRLKYSVIDRIPHSLYLEILYAVKESNNLTQEEADNINFMQPSSTVTLTAPETSEHAPAVTEP